MTKQPTALRLADLMDAMDYDDTKAAAAELRRLHELNEGLRDQNTQLDKKLAELERVNAQLLEALEFMVEVCPAIDPTGGEAHDRARAAIAAAKGEA